MLRLRNVLLTAALAALVLAVWMSLHGCDRKTPAPDPGRQLALEQQRREAAESRVAVWQLGAMALGGAAVLALIVGAALGSRARHDARRSAPHGPEA